MKRFLLVDDDSIFSEKISYALQKHDCVVETALSVEQAISLIKKYKFDAYIIDINLNSDKDGFFLGDYIKTGNPSASIIVISSSTGISPVSSTLKHRFDHFLSKTMDYSTFACKIVEIAGYVSDFSEHFDVDVFRGHGLITKNKEMLKNLSQISKFKNSTNILIEGETGTGKELVARYIASVIAPQKPFITVNCPAIPETLMESVLFGHVKGAFTGADRDKTGKFEEAEGGVIFLDEISSADMELQKKLLRVIQNQEIEKVGSAKTLKCNVKIIAATNENLCTKVNKNEFRNDLLFRLKRHTISLLPLRQRPEDIELLINHFAGDRKDIFTKEVISVLKDYLWPGNVRELENFVYDVLFKTEGGRKVILKDLVHLFASEEKEQNMQCRTDNVTENQVVDFMIEKAKENGLINSLKTLEENIISAEFSRCKNLSECSHKLKIDPSGLSKRIRKNKLK